MTCQSRAILLRHAMDTRLICEAARLVASPGSRPIGVDTWVEVLITAPARRNSNVMGTDSLASGWRALNAGGTLFVIRALGVEASGLRQTGAPMSAGRRSKRRSAPWCGKPIRHLGIGRGRMSRASLSSSGCATWCSSWRCTGTGIRTGVAQPESLILRSGRSPRRLGWHRPSWRILVPAGTLRSQPVQRRRPSSSARSSPASRRTTSSRFATAYFPCCRSG